MKLMANDKDDIINYSLVNKVLKIIINCIHLVFFKKDKIKYINMHFILETLLNFNQRII